MVRPKRNKQVNMVACDSAGNDLQFMFHSDLTEKVARENVAPTLPSSEGEGFPPSPKGTLIMSTKSMAVSELVPSILLTERALTMSQK